MRLTGPAESAAETSCRFGRDPDESWHIAVVGGVVPLLPSVSVHSDAKYWSGSHIDCVKPAHQVDTSGTEIHLGGSPWANNPTPRVFSPMTISAFASATNTGQCILPALACRKPPSFPCRSEANEDAQFDGVRIKPYLPCHTHAQCPSRVLLVDARSSCPESPRLLCRACIVAMSCPFYTVSVLRSSLVELRSASTSSWK